MSRFEDVWEDCDGMIPPHLWDQIVSNALSGRRGQMALAELEEALLALPEKKLVEGHLAAEGSVCAVGAFVAAQKAKKEGLEFAAAVAALNENGACLCGHPRSAHDPAQAGNCTGERWDGGPCTCSSYDTEYEGAHDTAEAGKAAGLTWSVAWHLAYLNDEKFGSATPEERYQRMLAWVQTARGRREPTATEPTP